MKNNIPVIKSAHHQIIKLFFTFTYLFIYSFAHSQSFYPQNYFQSPLDTPIYLSAPFGSLRENHFHSGMDIRTYEHEGLPVYAVADGFVARIKVSPVGYGKAIYIQHPNGYMSVYGHLQRYEGAIAEYIKKYQYQNEMFEFDNFPSSTTLKIKKGQIIGWSGNSGGSTGPHLHFEIRDSRTEEPLNPQLFGIRGVDFGDPQIKRILIYNLDCNRPLITKKLSVSKKNTIRVDSVIFYNDTIEIPCGLVGFAVEAYDYMVDAEHEYSLYGMEMYIDDKEFFSYRLDRIDFENSRCVNVHIDYEQYKRNDIRYQKCFLDDGNIYKIYNYLRNKGKYFLNDEAVHKVSFCVCDIAGHSESFSFFIHNKLNEIQHENKNKVCSSSIFYPKTDNIFKTQNLIIEVPAKVLYDTLEFCFDILKEKEKNSFSPVYKIHDQFTPLHKSFTISIKPENFPEKLQAKLLIAYFTKEGNIHAVGGEYKNGFVTARNNNFGNYFVTLDSIAPTIKSLNISHEGFVKDTFGLKFKIDDNLSGISTYRGTINGKWVLMDFDLKNDLLVYEFDEKTQRNEKIEFVLQVTDKKNNVSTFRKEIIISSK